MSKITKAFRLSFWMVTLGYFLCHCSGKWPKHRYLFPGKVVESESNEPLIGVNILVKGKEIGTITDTNGKNFTLQISQPPPPYFGVFLMIGFCQPGSGHNGKSGIRTSCTLEEQTMAGSTKW